ncbi:hypothetical protein ACO0K0_02595 [Undibacterium sp. SXout11W]|uniref:hypothetical protein n=1 Tax=Undibacterium sp. SXout11W TaxID=3413050 RepID=UPI003BF200A8
MIGIPETNTLSNATISGVSHEGLTITLKNGKPAKLAIIDEDGHIIEAGQAVAKEAWNVTLAVYKNMMIGKGHLRIFSSPPPGIANPSHAA